MTNLYSSKKNGNKKLRNTNQERCEDGKEGSKAKNNRIPYALIKHWFASKEAALPHTATSVSGHVIVLARKLERRTLRPRGSHEEDQKASGGVPGM